MNNVPGLTQPLYRTAIITFVATQLLRSQLGRWAYGNIVRKRSEWSEDTKAQALKFLGKDVVDIFSGTEEDVHASFFDKGLLGHVTELFSMSLATIKFERPFLITSDIPFCFGHMGTKDDPISPAEDLWYLLPVSRKVAIFLGPPEWPDVCVSGSPRLAKAICLTMLRHARGPTSHESARKAAEWSYAYRHPDDDDIDGYLWKSSAALESASHALLDHVRDAIGKISLVPVRDYTGRINWAPVAIKSKQFDLIPALAFDVKDKDRTGEVDNELRERGLRRFAPSADLSMPTLTRWTISLESAKES